MIWKEYFVAHYANKEKDAVNQKVIISRRAGQTRPSMMAATTISTLLRIHFVPTYESWWQTQCNITLKILTSKPRKSSTSSPFSLFTLQKRTEFLLFDMAGGGFLQAYFLPVWGRVSTSTIINLVSMYAVGVVESNRDACSLLLRLSVHLRERWTYGYTRRRSRRSAPVRRTR